MRNSCEFVLNVRTSKDILPGDSKEIRYETTTSGNETPVEKIVLGENSYLVKTVKKDGLPVKLYVDRNNDGSFTGEKPLKATIKNKFNQFEIDNLTGKFKIGSGFKSVRLQIYLIFDKANNVNVIRSWTNFYGKIETKEGEIIVAWIPGKLPWLTRSKYEFVANTICNGNKKITVDEKDFTIKNGKVTGKYKIEKDKSLVHVKAPESMSCVYLFIKDSGIVFNAYGIVSYPEKGKLFLPEGNYSFAVLGFVKETKRNKQMAVMTIPKFEVNRKTTIGEIEPLKLVQNIQCNHNTFSIIPVIKNCSGQPVAIKTLPIRLKIRTTDGKELASHNFKAG
ncbi:MAG: hypothetical protein ABIH42_04180 [Planctomycetota bacterium]